MQMLDVVGLRNSRGNTPMQSASQCDLQDMTTHKKQQSADKEPLPLSQRTRSLKSNLEASIQVSDNQRSSNTMIVNESGLALEDANRHSLGGEYSHLFHGQRSSMMSRQVVNHQRQHMPETTSTPSTTLQGRLAVQTFQNPKAAAPLTEDPSKTTSEIES